MAGRGRERLGVLPASSAQCDHCLLASLSRTGRAAWREREFLVRQAECGMRPAGSQSQGDVTWKSQCMVLIQTAPGTARVLEGCWQERGGQEGAAAEAARKTGRDENQERQERSCRVPQHPAWRRRRIGVFLVGYREAHLVVLMRAESVEGGVQANPGSCR